VNKDKNRKPKSPNNLDVGVKFKIIGKDGKVKRKG